MKRTVLLGSILLLQLHLYSQSYDFRLSKEIKLKKGVVDLDLISADNSGMYYAEDRVREDVHLHLCLNNFEI